MSGAPNPEPRRRGYWLIASLCLNFFLIGVVVTGLVVARNRMIAAAMNGGGGLAPEAVLEMLPQSGAAKMCDVLAARLDKFRALGRETVDARRAVFKVFRTEPYDGAAFQTALARLTAAQAAALQERAATTAEVVARLTSEERKYFSRKVAQRFLSLTRPLGTQLAPGKLAQMCETIGAGTTKLPQ